MQLVRGDGYIALKLQRLLLVPNGQRRKQPVQVGNGKAARPAGWGDAGNDVVTAGHVQSDALVTDAVQELGEVARQGGGADDGMGHGGNQII